MVLAKVQPLYSRNETDGQERPYFCQSGLFGGRTIQNGFVENPNDRRMVLAKVQPLYSRNETDGQERPYFCQSGLFC